MAPKLAKESGKGAAIGFVCAAAGATGITTKILLDWNDPDKVQQEHVDRCMYDRGHQVLGWR